MRCCNSPSTCVGQGACWVTGQPGFWWEMDKHARPVGQAWLSVGDQSRVCEGGFPDGQCGCVHAAQILAIPDDMEYYGRGPLLAAKELDLDVLWGRARQIQAVCEQARAWPSNRQEKYRRMSLRLPGNQFQGATQRLAGILTHAGLTQRCARH